MKNEKPKILLQSLKLIDDIFSSSHAKDLIDVKINYNKICQLNLGQNNSFKTGVYNKKRLEELLTEKKRLMKTINDTQANKRKIKLISLIDIEYQD